MADDAAEADEQKKLGNGEAEDGDERIGHHPGDEDGTAAADDLAEVHLQADDEEEKDEAELGDGVDVVGIGDQAQAKRPGDDTGEDVAGDRRQVQAREENGEHAGEEETDADIVDQRRHGAFRGEGRRAGATDKSKADQARQYAPRKRPRTAYRQGRPPRLRPRIDSLRLSLACMHRVSGASC